MKTEELEVSRLEEATPRPGDSKSAVACAFCRRRLADEFYFTCRRCEASYCYIHMSRHQPAPCAREVRRGLRARAPQQGEGLPVPNGNQLLMTGPRPSPKDRSVQGLLGG
ncbi:MAG: hypothetical protein OK442_08795 [Thaumarchaeota archaeon]|nr:hypothetical protein [Nitrososphaerota archaeon]